MVRTGANALLFVTTALLLAGCDQSSTPRRQWSRGAPPNQLFAPWEGAEFIRLPVSEAQFALYLKKLNAQQYTAGDVPGADMPFVPPPFDRRKCNGTRAIVFQLPDASRASGRQEFVAYSGSDKMVGCIENHTLTPSP